MTAKAIMRNHGNFSDWCHFCGERTDKLTDVFYAQNAEHDTEEVSDQEAVREKKYVRVCSECGICIAAVAMDVKAHLLLDFLNGLRRRREMSNV